ncbi:MAG: cellulose-binding protein [Dactylosporangium sp.]|nr:cellulose binding domain-containing protein [Dactylosporangium sp.]NNJ62080.1 cellulose-binding protein [Dactylosporangium sp.]
MKVRKLVTPLRAALLSAMCVAATVPLWYQPPADALEAPVDEPVTGNATWYDALGVPYGGCGMTEDALETQDYIALNVYNTPKDYVYYTRPMPEGDPKIGMWDNGHNCGRWVEVTIGDYCTGTNDGVANEEFCRLGGEWVTDEYNGAKLNMIVADSCGDSNAWCRDDPYHIDLRRGSLNTFVKDGAPVGDMDPEHWNNRQVSWKFIPAPDYSGDIEIGFLQGSKTGWTAVAISRLANGIHGVDYWFEDAWHDAEMDGDMGQAFIIEPHEVGEAQYSIRVRDVGDEYVNAGRVYTFDLPATCDPECSPAYQKIEYTTGSEPPGTGASAVPKTCSATPQIVQSWPGGYEAEVTVTAGGSKIRGWSVDWTLASDQTMGDVWNGIRSVDGSTVTVTNVSWNGTVAADESATFGFLVSGGDSIPTMACTAT